eukprot:TRINITY_DN4511_c0_g1_i5.p2 TRINITY_DN4511_c0_g1~~TRINITY_DN4511_c0_g1_i5.p2  ORF type:complete len:107 (-),score=36.45 TRINITY_DN4511_c0_g1_i5:108-428(-)
MLDFEFIQPPLSPDHEPYAGLLLLVLDTPSLPKKDGVSYVISEEVERFIWDYANSCCEEGFEKEEYYQFMMRSLRRNQKLFLKKLPWERRPTYTLPSGPNKLKAKL